MPMKLVLIDTNLLLDGFQINDEYKYVLLSHVNRELEKHKTYGDSELKFKARRASRFIEENEDCFVDDVKDYNVTFCPYSDNMYTDNKIIQACLDNGYSLLTNDRFLRQKAKAYGIDAIKPDSDSAKNKDYTGLIEVELTQEEQSFLYENISINNYGLVLNQFLVIKDTDGNYVDKLRWNGNEHVKVKWKKVSSRYLGEIKPRNQKQEILFNILQDDSITVKSCFGRYGSGKDYCMISHAISFIESQKFDKIVFCRNQIPLKEAPESGFRKGDNFDKMIEFAMPLADAVGGVEMLRLMVERGQVELQDLSRIRGRDIKNAIIYVTEFQNNTSEHARLLLGRVGEGSQLWINGDLQQTDKDIFSSNSGIIAMTNLKGNELYGQVTLDKTERSKTASLSELI